MTDTPASYPWNDTPLQQRGPFVIDWLKRVRNRRGTVVLDYIASRHFETEAEARKHFQLGTAAKAILRHKAETIAKLQRGAA